METKNLDELKANPKNPRSINKHDYEALVASIRKFGDLSGIVFNVRSGQLVGGHQRTQAFKRMAGDKQIVITQRFETPNAQGTVALGHVKFEGEQYSYREVDWDEGTELSANIAANRIQGQFDLDLLAQVNYEISQLENGANLLNDTGQTNDEINKLLAMVTGEPEIDLPAGDKPGFQTISFTLSDDQAAVVNEATTYMKEHESFEGMENKNSNGNALFLVAREFLDYTNGEKNEPSQTN